MHERVELGVKNPEWLTAVGPLNKLGSELVLAKHGFRVPPILTFGQAQELLNRDPDATVMARGYCLQAKADAAGVDVWPSRPVVRGVDGSIRQFIDGYEASLAAKSVDPLVAFYYQQMEFDLDHLTPRYFLQQHIQGQLITAMNCEQTVYVQGRDKRVAFGLVCHPSGRHEWKHYYESLCLNVGEIHQRVSEVIKKELGMPVDCLTEMVYDGQEKIWVVQARVLPLGAKIVFGPEKFSKFPAIEVSMKDLRQNNFSLGNKPYVLKISGIGEAYGSRPSLSIDYGDCQGLVFNNHFWPFSFLNHYAFRLVNLMLWKGKPVAMI